MKILKELRLNKKLKQKDVAEYLGIDRSTYGKYETGDSEPNFEMLLKLSDYFNVSIDYLIGKHEDKFSPSGLTNEEKEMLERFRSLNPERQDRVLEELRDAYAAQRAREQHK